MNIGSRVSIQTNEIYQSLDSLDMEKDTHNEYNDELLLNIIEDINLKKKKKNMKSISCIRNTMKSL